MTIKTKLKNKFIIFSLVTAIGIMPSFLLWRNIKAETPSIADELTAEEEETQEKIEELEKRADIYREIIDIKKKQGETLNNQLEITDTNIQQVQAQIEVSKQQIDDYNSQITRIEAQIKEKGETILSQKEMLANLMQAYYEVNLVSPIISYLTSGNIASFIVEKDRLSQTGDKIKELVESVKKIRDDLELQSKDLDKKKGEFVVTKEKLQSQGSTLESAKKQKETLLAQTKGEEARYAQLLARVEEQKQDLLNMDQLFLSGNFSVGGLSASEYIEKNKPSSSLFASTSWFYSQKDPKWADVNIGNSTSDMKNWGCAVTSVAMVAKFYGDSITPGALAKKPIFSFDLMKWQMNEWSGAKISLVSTYGSAHRNLSWSVIDSSIKNKHPVIVYIGKTGGKGGHYVVIHNKDSKTGKYVVHDPYFGANLFLDTSRALVGAMGVSTATYMDQMIIYED
ncbi:MAG: Membrane protein [Parcubacteria group bacterium GW2011_GWD2_38_11]|nr:MAG: Membrane protein [Parcubacteria group bacterium GW2011_GWD2_38_11]